MCVCVCVCVRARIYICMLAKLHQIMQHFIEDCMLPYPSDVSMPVHSQHT